MAVKSAASFPLERTPGDPPLPGFIQLAKESASRPPSHTGSPAAFAIALPA